MVTKPAARPLPKTSAARKAAAAKTPAAVPVVQTRPAVKASSSGTGASSAPPKAAGSKRAAAPAAKPAAAAQAVSKPKAADAVQAVTKPKAADAVQAVTKPKAAAAAQAVSKHKAPVAKAPAAKAPVVPTATMARLTLSSRNYSSWSLRGYLLAQFAGLAVEEVMVAQDDPDRRAELLLLSPSILVPMLEHEGLKIWDVIAIAEYLAERFPQAGLLPADPAARARCRSICGEIHSGFSSLRAALPVNLRMRHSQFKVWSRAQSDLDRIFLIWRECLAQSGGPFLFGQRSMADAMYAPVVTRLRTYDVAVPPELTGYCSTILAMPEMLAWEAAALNEPDQLQEFDVEF